MPEERECRHTPAHPTSTLPNEITVCVACRKLLIGDDHGAWRDATPAELASVTCDGQISMDPIFAAFSGVYGTCQSTPPALRIIFE